MSTTVPIGTVEVAAAERLAGVSYSKAERALMLGRLTRQAAQAVARRGVPLPETLAPSTRFDPRLPGFTPPPMAPARPAPPPPPLPADKADIAFAGLEALGGWIASGALSSTRLTTLYLDRIARLNPRLLCFTMVTAAQALAQAQAADALLAQGRHLGPLHGIPYGMKDIVDTAGIVTDWGAEPYLGRVPETDAHVTEVLREAGAVLLGKTSVGALAYGDLWHGGRTRNPWNPAEGSSGSSAGSASAVAAGLCGFGVATETLGSIVSPSHRCGTVGLRPTFGRISRRGVMPLCWSLDKLGALTRDAAGALLAVSAMAAPDPRDPFQIALPVPPMPALPKDRPLAGLRLGWYPQDMDAADPIDRAALDAARTLGAETVALERRDLPYDALNAILSAEAAASFEALTLLDRDDLLTWQDEAAWPNAFRAARFLSAVDHLQLDRLRRLVMQEMDAVFRRVDLILGPSLVGPMLTITNYTGHPCLCLPAGYRNTPPRTLWDDAAGDQQPARVPHTVSLWAGLFDEGRLAAVGAALQAILGATERPPA